MPENWENANVTPGFKKDKESTGNKQLVSLTSNPGKVMADPGGNLWARGDKKVIRTSQQGFTKGKS